MRTLDCSSGDLHGLSWRAFGGTETLKAVSNPNTPHPAPNRKRLTICVNATRNTSTGKAPQKTSPRGRRHGHKAFSPSGDARNMWKSKDCSLMRDHWSVGSSVALAQTPEGQLMYEPWPEQSSPVSCEFSLVAKEVRGRAVCSVRSLMQTPSALAFLLFIEIYLQDKA